MANSWVHVPIERPDARLRLFCFPCAGGTAANYHSWPILLPDDVEVCAIELPGRRARLTEPPFTQMGALLDALRSSLSSFLDRPSVFFGHSMGAILAFELALRLRATGLRLPLRLIISSCRAPQIVRRERDMHELPDPEFLAEIQKIGGMDADALRNAEFVALVMPMLRADCALTETWRYVPREPLHLPIDVYGGLSDPQVTRDDLDGWRAHTTAGFRLKQFAGDHFYLIPRKDELLRDISQSLPRTFG